MTERKKGWLRIDLSDTDTIGWFIMAMVYAMFFISFVGLGFLIWSAK